MFIFDAFWGLVQIGVFAGTGLFVWSEYRRGWPTMIAMGEKLNVHVKRMLGREDHLDIADGIVSKYASNVHQLREAIASCETDAEQQIKEASGQLLLAKQFEEEEREALMRRDDTSAAIAASYKINALKRAQMFAESADANIQVVKALKEERFEAEADYDIAQTEADTIRTGVSITEANKHRYESISEMSLRPGSGLTARGELKRLVDKTEHDKIVSQKMVNLAKEYRNGRTPRRFSHQGEIQRELEEMRMKISLPAPETNGDGMQTVESSTDAEVV